MLAICTRNSVLLTISTGKPNEPFMFPSALESMLESADSSSESAKSNANPPVGMQLLADSP